MTLVERKNLGPWTHLEMEWYWMYGGCKDCGHRINTGDWSCAESCLESVFEYLEEYQWEEIREGFYDQDLPLVPQVQQVMEEGRGMTLNQWYGG